MKSEDDVMSVSIIEILKIWKVKRRVAAEIKIEPIAPTAPASVAVKYPEKRPPNTTQISRRTGQIFRMTFFVSIWSASNGRGGAMSGRNQQVNKTTIEYMTAVRIPIDIPPTKTFVTDVSAKTPKTIIRIEGGISAPIVPPAAIDPVAKEAE
jgi:hypothetical protein